MGKYSPYSPCGWCGLTLDVEWAQTNQRFCSRRCRNAEWYSRHKEHHRALYEANKSQWARSPSGRREGILIGEWLRLPKDWR